MHQRYTYMAARTITSPQSLRANIPIDTTATATNATNHARIKLFMAKRKVVPIMTGSPVNGWQCGCKHFYHATTPFLYSGRVVSEDQFSKLHRSAGKRLIWLMGFSGFSSTETITARKLCDNSNNNHVYG